MLFGPWVLANLLIAFCNHFLSSMVSPKRCKSLNFASDAAGWNNRVAGTQECRVSRKQARVTILWQFPLGINNLPCHVWVRCKHHTPDFITWPAGLLRRVTNLQNIQNDVLGDYGHPADLVGSFLNHPLQSLKGSHMSLNSP